MTWTKTIIWLIVVVAVVGCGLLAGQQLRDIEGNARIKGFLTMWGTVYPVWSGYYDLGKSNLVWDSVFANYLTGQIDTSQAAFTTYVSNHAGGGGGARNFTVVVAASDARATSKTGADFVCDGTTDEVEIQQAIDTVAVYGGGRVVLTEGNFSITGSTPIVIDGSKDNLVLEGQGYGTVLKIADGYTTSRNIISFPYSSPGAENVIIRNIRFNGNLGGWATGGGSTIIAMTYSAYCQFQSCWFDSAYNHGLLMQDCRTILVNDCFFRWNRQNATQCQNDSDIVLTNNVFYNNIAAIEIYANSDWITFADNLVYNNTVSGLFIGTDVGAPRIKGLFVTGNVFRGDNAAETGNPTVLIARCDSFYVTNNIIDYYQYPVSILLLYATNGWIGNNVMRGRLDQSSSTNINIFGPQMDRGLNKWAVVDPVNTDTLYITSKGISGPRVRGSDTGGAQKTADTVLIPGALATDAYFVQWKGTTIATRPLAQVAKAGTLIVNCIVGDTAKFRTSGYNWVRYQ